jgi:TetR/AcrR family transcriptional regulator, cholesterol catabolism regulator
MSKVLTAPADGATVRRARGRPRKTANERDDGNRRQDLLRAAARLFRGQGFAATSTRDIATAAGMRSGSPFYHFDNKEALLAAVMREGMENATRRQEEAMERATAVLKRGRTLTAREALRVLVRNHFDVLLGPDSDFIPVMLYEWRSLSDAQRVEVKHLKDRYEAVWVPVLRALHGSGEMKGDPALARLMLFGALNWSVQWFDAGRSATLDDLTEAALQLFLKDHA